MSKSFPAVKETCACSGGISDNGTQRGWGIVWKWMDGRIVKEDTVRRGAYPVVPGIPCATEASDEEPSTISSCMRGEYSRGSCAVSIEGCSRWIRDREEEEDPLGLDQV